MAPKDTEVRSKLELDEARVLVAVDEIVDLVAEIFENPSRRIERFVKRGEDIEEKGFCRFLMTSLRLLVIDI